MSRSFTEILNRVIHFNYGQRLTPDQLNTLSDHARARDAVISRILFGAEGIVEGFREELRITLADDEGMVVQIHPGVCINAHGEILNVEHPMLVSLSDTLEGVSGMVYLCLKPEVSLESPISDPEVPEFQGYEWKSFQTKVVVTQNPSEDSVEIARIRTDGEVKKLRLVLNQTEVEAPVGVLDQRHAKRVMVYNRNLASFKESMSYRKSLRQFRASLVQIGQIYPNLKYLKTCLDRSMLIEAEVAERLFPRAKVHFLLGETKKTLLDLLEEIREQMRETQKELAPFWSLLFRQVENLNNSQGEAGAAEFQALDEITASLNDNVLKISNAEEKALILNESLKDIRNFDFAFRHKHSFGGVLYKMVEAIDVQALGERLENDCEFSTIKSVRARFEDGTAFSGRGRFYSQGQLRLALTQLEKGYDAIVIMKIYKRRGDQSFRLSFNGDLLLEEHLNANQSVDRMLNIGVRIPAESVAGGKDLFGLELTKVALDFGLFGIWIYQATPVEEM